ncbi:MAG: DUF805 domain-containing protein [Acidobacteria bacterium]|nr:DUF805 domain-containing protein [Acidobacteriota bacterium]
MRFTDLWRWRGRVDRKTYAVVGFVAFVIKHVIDWRITLYLLHDHSGLIFNYWSPLGASVRLSRLSSYQSTYLATLLIVALPFIWLGLAMTVKRLRDAGWPVWLTAIFFVPVANVLFILVLCAVSSSVESASPRRDVAPWPKTAGLGKLIPDNKIGSALFAILVSAILGLVAFIGETTLLGTYGWGLFVALPFCLGLFSVLSYSYHRPREFGESMAVALLPIGLIGAISLIVALEGLICILMAAPIAVILAALGGMLGYSMQASYWMRHGTSSAMCAIVLVLPMIFGAEHAAKLETPRFVVRTSIEINAPPETVWKQVVAFSEIAPPTELLFRAGVAYPVRAEITGHGPGAVRHCVFSTGPFVEPIEVWDEPKLLSFGVTSTPSPMNELTPYGHIEPKHLHGYFVSEHGQFALMELPGGRTRLEGATSYRNTIWPGQYWRLWSDYIIHRIHTRVLEHIKMEAEAGKPLSPAVS